MDKLGERIVRDRAEISAKMAEAERLEHRAEALRREAAELERLLQLSRLHHS
jgi:hypothetical protein